MSSSKTVKHSAALLQLTAVMARNAQPYTEQISFICTCGDNVSNLVPLRCVCIHTYTLEKFTVILEMLKCTTYAQKLKGKQLNLPHGTQQKINTKNYLKNKKNDEHKKSRNSL